MKLLVQLEAPPAEPKKGAEAMRGRIGVAVTTKLPAPSEHAGIETGADVDGAVALRHPTKGLPDDSGAGKGIGVAGHDEARVAIGTTAADLAFVDNGDVPAGARQKVRRGHSYAAGPDDDRALSHTLRD